MAAAVRGGNWRDVVSESRPRALCELAERLTRAPGACTERDLEAPRSAGLDDRGIHDLVLIVAYFNFVNRIASGLCVDLEGESGDDSGDPREF